MAKITPATVQKYLGGMDYPADKDELIMHAHEHGADSDVLNTLKNLSVNEFNSPVDVSKAIRETANEE
ncbi:MAG: DUF2795 domain-containing protein [Candidatus Yanofskybacteria bacterium]|nr:DUF2795 domain-containing protein [Candidatus Yanofskybacteria bacterium]